MKKTAILISILLISTAAFSQRVIPVAKRTFPKTQNQITKEDAMSDEFGKEYVERPFQGIEEDTAAINADFLRRENTDMRDFEKAEAERKKSQKSTPANKK